MIRDKKKNNCAAPQMGSQCRQTKHGRIIQRISKQGSVRSRKVCVQNVNECVRQRRRRITVRYI